LTKTKINS